jgi:hypothetical protein
MKSIVTGMFFGFLCIFPIVCSAAWVIHLKDGRSFTTPEYREEGNQIKFERYGGTIGLPKDQLVSIEEIADLPEKEVLKPPEQPAVSENVEDAKKVKEQGTPAQMSVEEKKNAEWEKIAKMQKLLEEKRQIMREKEAVITSYKEAKARKSREKKEQYWNELLSLRKKLENLRERAVAENGGGLPDWWDNAK